MTFCLKAVPKYNPRRRQSTVISEALVKQLEQLNTEFLEITPEPDEVTIVIKSNPVYQCELAEMMNDPQRRGELISKINEIQNINDRKSMIENLYNQTLTQKQGDIVLNAFDLDTRFASTRAMLQDLYLQAMKDDWSTKIDQICAGDPNRTLTQEEADEIYQECIMPEFNSDVLNPRDEQRQQFIMSDINIQKKSLFSASDAPIEQEVDVRDRKKAFV